MPSVMVRAWRIVCSGMRQDQKLLFAIPAMALLALGACTGAVTQEEEVETEVAVQVGTVMKADLQARVEAYGMVEPEPAKSGHPGGGAKLAAPFAGIVVAVHVIEGQSVKAGDMVVELDDRMAQATVEKARHALSFAQQVADRLGKLISSGAVSMQLKQEADQRLAAARAELAAAQAAIAQVQLASPLDGVVARINVQPGQSVDLNTMVAEIIDPKRLVVTVNVPAEEAMQLEHRSDRGSIHRQCQETGDDRPRVVRQSVRRPKDQRGLGSAGSPGGFGIAVRPVRAHPHRDGGIDRSNSWCRATAW